MKKQKLGKRISLNKVTVSNLNNLEMNRINGGTGYTGYATCDVYTCTPTCESLCIRCPEVEPLV